MLTISEKIHSMHSRRFLFHLQILCLRGDVELVTLCEFIETDNQSENKININSNMNRFLICSAIKFNQLIPIAMI